MHIVVVVPLQQYLFKPTLSSQQEEANYFQVISIRGAVEPHIPDGWCCQNSIITTQSIHPCH